MYSDENLEADNMAIFQDNKSFCACVRPCQKQITCECGEPKSSPSWGWNENKSSSAIKCCDKQQLVYFHKGFSSGNACVVGDMKMTRGNHYYWELRMISSVYGTSIMFGVGTENFDPNQSHDKYCDLLGCDSESWGMNFGGKIFHNNQEEKYHPLAGFTIGSIIGIHLDMWNGTLEYYLNRIPLGVAFRGLRDKILYPLISSTAAHSIVKLIYTSSEPFSLHMMSFRSLPCVGNLPPGLSRYLPNCWWLLPKSSRTRTDTVTLCSSQCDPSHDVYIMVSSDSEPDGSAGALLAQRMRRVAENLDYRPFHPHTFRPFHPRTFRYDTAVGDVVEVTRPIRRTKLRPRIHWADF